MSAQQVVPSRSAHSQPLTPGKALDFVMLIASQVVAMTLACLLVTGSAVG